MDTQRLLKIAQEYFDHEYAPYVGGASLLTGAVAWFYATDLNRALMVSLVPRLADELPSQPFRLAHRLPSGLP